ncbi:hypothetical protein I41_49850 [Lacipirellula limnantheis]|jgi:hypothetical protein|uniref:Uncharacterized protein n=1 Tax=Lacipirellula limnantheis TaxID=2528024 RepID=A0A517U558_9BACT|nr:hypothetical protein I41_49850 [Lacipirellula limnantheis]
MRRVGCERIVPKGRQGDAFFFGVAFRLETAPVGRPQFGRHVPIAGTFLGHSNPLWRRVIQTLTKPHHAAIQESGV